MLNRSFLLLLVTAFLVPSYLCQAQDVDGQLLNLNEALYPSYEISRKKGDLTIKGFREGEQVKTDEVNVYDLDFETLKYSESENAVIIKCFADVDGCVMRILQRERKKKTFRNRVVFAVPEGKTGLEIEEKLRRFLMDLSKNTK